MRVPQLVTAIVWLLTGSLAAVPAAAAPGRGDGRTAASSRWAYKLDRGLQKRLAARMDRRGESKTLRVIIRTRQGVDLKTSAIPKRFSNKARTNDRFGFSLINGIIGEVKEDDLLQLVELPEVEGVSIDAPVAVHQSAYDGCSTAYTGTNGACADPSSQYSVVRGAMAYRSNNWDGAGVGVAVIDSGVSASDELNITASYDFRSGAAVASAPTDGYGHGTHVAHLVSSTGARSNGAYQGVAPGARIIALRVLDNNGGGYTSHVIKAIEFAITNRTSLGIHVINLSLGHVIYEPAASDPLVLAVESAVRAGIVVVVSAGNNGVNPTTGLVGFGGISSPGNAPSAITVGTVNLNNTVTHTDDTVAPYSSRGPTWFDGFAKPDVLAPGHRLVAPVATSSRLYQTLPLSRMPETLGGLGLPASELKPLRLSGTSMSTGVVSGVVASMLDVQQTYFGRKPTPNAVKAMLQYSALPLDSQPRLAQGAGEVNLLGALRLARRANGNVAMGGYWMTSLPTPSTSVDGQDLPWFARLMWDNHVVWGDTVFYNQSLFATHIVWGDNASPWAAGDVDPFHIVWGDTAVWVNHIVWGDSLLGVVDGNHIVWGDSTLTEANNAWQGLEDVGAMSFSLEGLNSLLEQEPLPPPAPPAAPAPEPTPDPAPGQ